MDGQVARQTSSYRQGLVLGFTMAEIVLLLVFCLLIAMATILRKEQTRREAIESQLRIERAQGGADREFTAAIKRNPELIERLSKATSSGDVKAIDEFWRELVESHAIVSTLQKEGLSLQEMRERAVEGKKMKERGIDVTKAIRHAEVVGSISKVIPQAGNPSMSPQAIADAIKAIMSGGSLPGHRWPPIIKLSEAEGYSFQSGSAELSSKLRQELIEATPLKIVDLINRYDVNIIEVVGHTDEQPLGVRQSNLDRDLLAVLNNDARVASLVPADNAGLGLARAVSVVSVLRQSKALAGYRIIPLSGAQLVNTDETLAIEGMAGDIPQRRRIEIRLRQSDRSESSVETPRSSDTPVPQSRPARPVKRPAPTGPNPFPRPL